MGAIGRKMYLNMKRFERRAFLHCLDYGGDENSLQPGAECLVHAHDKTLHVINRHRRKKRSTNPTKPNALKTFIIRHNLHKTITSKRLRKLKKRETMNESSEEQHKRHKREESKERVAALTQIYKNYKKQKERFNLRMMTEEESKKHYESWLTDYIVKTVDKPPALISSKDEKTPVKRITNLISTVVEKRPYYRSVSDTLRTLNEMSSRSKNQSTYGANLKDIVTDYDPLLRKKIPFTKRFRNLMPTSDNMPKVLKGAFDLADTLEKHGDVLNTKILSPRFMPLINNHAKGNTAHLFSPNIMPFYKDDSENNILPLPDIIDSTGLKADDRESIIELIMEMSGAQTIVEDAFKIFKSNQSDSLLEDVDQVTQGMDELFDKFKGMLTHHQRRELAQQKYTFMNDRQLDFIYGHGGMLNSTLHRHGVNDYKRMSNREKEKLLINDLRRLADDVPKSKHTRKKEV
ncbi:unnamed protein product [Bursaphelenchus okinawaensis]|uniref:Uncharacterized protein n=1 Tax=Bursaphelenchus okinawaensis TaxID=465554 RepID=A0A811L636_9BILA|nr:unnamed protein product [Bursaphelenchus okinawaensis]CAG9117331.1 unnamed protein product [Bursaphelenchus okinawaensis]